MPKEAQREAVCGGEGSLERGGPALAQGGPLGRGCWDRTMVGLWGARSGPQGAGFGGVGFSGGAIKTGKTGNLFHLF